MLTQPQVSLKYRARTAARIAEALYGQERAATEQQLLRIGFLGGDAHEDLTRPLTRPEATRRIQAMENQVAALRLAH